MVLLVKTQECLFEHPLNKYGLEALEKPSSNFVAEVVVGIWFSDRSSKFSLGLRLCPESSRKKNTLLSVKFWFHVLNCLRSFVLSRNRELKVLSVHKSLATIFPDYCLLDYSNLAKNIASQKKNTTLQPFRWCLWR